MALYRIAYWNQVRQCSGGSEIGTEEGGRKGGGVSSELFYAFVVWCGVWM